jgi:hypothetical protein
VGDHRHFRPEMRLQQTGGGRRQYRHSRAGAGA